jgi:mannose-1-phosphate guanylyltransferase
VKAFLLAAGLGTRLRPLTEHMPKCLLPVDGRSLIDIWLDALHRAGIDEVLVNLHHLPELVDDHLAARTSRGVGPEVRTVFEPELLGSAGTLRANRAWVEGEEFFLAINADNLTDFDLRILMAAHRPRGVLATLALFKSPVPSACGIVELGPDGLVAGFVEKPPAPVGDLANAGMYAFDPSALDLLDGVGGAASVDIGYHLLPLLVGRAGGVLVEGYFRDIGTGEAYELAQTEWRTRTSRAATVGAT